MSSNFRTLRQNTGIDVQCAAQGIARMMAKRYAPPPSMAVRLGHPTQILNAGCGRWCSHLANASGAATASLSYRPLLVAAAPLTSGFDLRQGVSNQCSVVTVALKCIVVEPRTWNRQTEAQTDDKIDASLKVPYRKRAIFRRSGQPACRAI